VDFADIVKSKSLAPNSSAKASQNTRIQPSRVADLRWLWRYRRSRSCSAGDRSGKRRSAASRATEGFDFHFSTMGSRRSSATADRLIERFIPHPYFVLTYDVNASHLFGYKVGAVHPRSAFVHASGGGKAACARFQSRSERSSVSWRHARGMLLPRPRARRALCSSTSAMPWPCRPR